MNRRQIVFRCEGESLLAALDQGNKETGLLIVSGGNEIRSGAWAGQAQLAAAVAAQGFPVFRFDRRGVGDSTGDNRGFRSALPDITAALEAFRAQTSRLRRVVAMGNCDAASALMLFAGELAVNRLMLMNPWTIEDADEDAEPVHSPAALRRRYAAKLADPREWKRALGGGLDLAKLARGLRKAAGPAQASPLASEMRAGLERFGGRVDILLAERDRAAQLFLEEWDANDPRIARLPSASHSFAGPAERRWLLGRAIAALAAEETH